MATENPDAILGQLLLKADHTVPAGKTRPLPIINNLRVIQFHKNDHKEQNRNSAPNLKVVYQSNQNTTKMSFIKAKMLKLLLIKFTITCKTCSTSFQKRAYKVFYSDIEQITTRSNRY